MHAEAESRIGEKWLLVVGEIICTDLWQDNDKGFNISSNDIGTNVIEAAVKNRGRIFATKICCRWHSIAPPLDIVEAIPDWLRVPITGFGRSQSFVNDSIRPEPAGQT